MPLKKAEERGTHHVKDFALHRLGSFTNMGSMVSHCRDNHFSMLGVDAGNAFALQVWNFVTSFIRSMYREQGKTEEEAPPGWPFARCCRGDSMPGLEWVRGD